MGRAVGLLTCESGSPKDHSSTSPGQGMETAGTHMGTHEFIDYYCVSKNMHTI